MPPREAPRPGVLLAATVLAVLSGLAAACQSQPTVTGYWEGKGTASDTPMKDDFRQMTRNSEAEFWFVVRDDGSAVGEAEVIYDAELRVDNLPQVSAGFVSFNPEVGGKVTDPDPRRRFPIVGFYDVEDQKLVMTAVLDSTSPKIEFTLRADPGVSAGMSASSGFGDSYGFSGSPGAGVIVQKIPMTPWSPFGDSGAEVQKRPGGPYEARYEERGENYSIQWSARQMGGEQREVELTPEAERALERLQREAG
ncbi:MAG: hypothetical protein ACREMD_12150 [Gemmatimonadota bacterium]